MLGTSLPSHRPSLALIDSDTGKLRRRIRLLPAIVNMPYITNPPDTLAFSPDGSHVLVSWDSPAVVDTHTGHVHTLWRTPAVATWSPDGHVIFLDVVNRMRFGALRSWSANDGARVIWTGPELAEKGIVAEHGIEYGQLRVAPDGSQLAIRTVSHNRTGIAIIPWSGTRPGKALTIDTVRGRVWDFDWSPDGTRIAAVVVQGSTGSVQMLELTTGRWSEDRLADCRLLIDGPDTLEAIAPIKKISWNG